MIHERTKYPASRQSVAGLLSASLFVVVLMQCSCDQHDLRLKPALSGSAPRVTSIVTDPLAVDFGMIKRGSSGEAVIMLRNSTGEKVTISRIDCSCPYLSLRMPLTVLSEYQEMKAKVKVDFKNETQFSGGLIITVQGIDDQSKVVFEFKATVMVQS